MKSPPEEEIPRAGLLMEIIYHIVYLSSVQEAVAGASGGGNAIFIAAAVAADLASAAGASAAGVFPFALCTQHRENDEEHANQNCSAYYYRRKICLKPKQHLSSPFPDRLKRPSLV